MAATAASAANDLTIPALPLYDRVEEPDGRKFTVTVTDADGEVLQTVTEYEGRVALIRVPKYSAGAVFTGWEGNDISAVYDNAAIIRIPGHDVNVKVLTEKLGSDVLLGKPCRASGEFNEREVGANALNGDDTSKWCADSEDNINWLEADAGEAVTVDKWFVMHAGAQESAAWNSRDFRLEYKLNEEDEWQTADDVKDNEETLTLRSFAPVTARYFRLMITRATQGRDGTVRIYMWQIYRAE